MADNKVKFLRGTAAEYANSVKDNDTVYFTTDDRKLHIGDKEIAGEGTIDVDTELSDTSENPVQNKVVKQNFDNKVDKTGGTMTGVLVAQSNTSYTTAQVRNATMSTSAPSGGSNGQVHYQYS